MPARFRNPFAALFARSRSEQHVEQYVLRELAHDRTLDEILNDHYVQNRTTSAQRERLLDRPEIVAAARRHAGAELGLKS